MNDTVGKTCLIIFLMLFIFRDAQSQQINQFNHSFYNDLIYNPAFTGNRDTTNIMLLSKEQWTGFNGAPSLNMIVIDGKLNKKMNLGGMLFNNSKGINRTIGGNLLYSYELKLSDVSHLNLGVSATFLSHSINLSNAIIQNISDPTIFETTQHQTNFDADFGLAYFWNELEIGIAASQVIGNRSSFFNEGGNSIFYKPEIHLVNSVRYTFNLGKEEGISLKPQALIRYVPNAPIQYEINTNGYFNNKFWVGLAYKNNYAIGINAGINLAQLVDIGYSYDIITSEIRSESGVSHELMLNFKFRRSKKGKRKAKMRELEKERKREKKGKKGKEDTEEIEEEQEDQTEEVQDLTVQEEKDVVTLFTSVADFKDKNQKIPEKGTYVVVGSFKIEDYAISYAKKIKAKGYPSANWFYSENRDYNYVYMFKETNKESAMKKINEARENGSVNAWLLILTE